LWLEVVSFASLPLRIDEMNRITYKVVKHDGGWAYEVNGTYSEKFPTREAARKAAKLAASEQPATGETTPIAYEDEKGHCTTKSPTAVIAPKLASKGFLEILLGEA
jgi:Uncharacterized protein conserved in bacteria (DUF2188)